MNEQLINGEYVLDDICTLISVTNTRGDFGERTEVRTERTVFCARKSAGQGEYYKALQEGMRAEGVLIVQSLEYNREQEVTYGGERYMIYRVYERDNGYTELYITERAGVS